MTVYSRWRCEKCGANNSGGYPGGIQTCTDLELMLRNVAAQGSECAYCHDELAVVLEIDLTLERTA